MSSANSRPLPPPAPSKRAEKPAPGNDRSTGVRSRDPSAPAINEAPAPAINEAPAPAGVFIPNTPAPAAEGVRNNSIAPDSLRRPYASLVPEAKKRGDTSPQRGVTPAMRPSTPSSPDMNWDDASSLTSSGSKSSRAICKKHKIARGKNGECMMCRKEEIQNSNGKGWKTIVALMVIAVLAGAVAAFLV